MGFWWLRLRFDTWNLVHYANLDLALALKTKALHLDTLLQLFHCASNLLVFVICILHCQFHEGGNFSNHHKIKESLKEERPPFMREIIYHLHISFQMNNLLRNLIFSFLLIQIIWFLHPLNVSLYGLNFFHIGFDTNNLKD